MDNPNVRAGEIAKETFDLLLQRVEQLAPAGDGENAYTGVCVGAFKAFLVITLAQGKALGVADVALRQMAEHMVRASFAQNIDHALALTRAEKLDA